ncbi:hypothetical protein BJ875DRAFT_365177 [Amylocarpus encephaloides]|uniref:RGS domain-containing protein n=1 Tax=Amylocarpus encephaloides TaxID=45428 RepID=A0A9P7YTQ3_9HELO|nr:hypothetical protein BJ875DRAFT_365177 [Amylocarpus encephaloides]
MRRAKHRKPPSLYLHTSSQETSPRCSSILEDWDADDEGFMSSGDFIPSRPLSLAIPSGPYCPRRPALHDVLASTAPLPWTLTAFMAYLSQNHCLETLEFTMDAKRYRKHYREMADRDPLTPLSPQTPEVEYVRMLWQKLLDAYIVPNGPREVNLPSNVRDHLVSLPCQQTPPEPSELDHAVKIIYELMEESVLVPFLNSLAPARTSESHLSPWTSDDSMTDTYMVGSLDERSLSPAQARRYRHDSPPMTDIGADMVSKSYSGISPRLSHQSHLSAAFGRGSRLSAHMSGSSSAATSSSEVPDILTDDSADSPSPSGSALEPMTPPNTPPTSNAGFSDVSPGTSPKTGRGEGSGLKLSEGDLSPVLEAHPGSPVDISSQLRPSNASSMSQRLYHGTDAEIARFEMRARTMGRKEDSIKRDGVAAKGSIFRGVRDVKGEGNNFVPNRRMQVARPQPFFIPAKINEQEEINVPPRLSVDTEMAMQYDFKTENGIWISANPLAMESRSSLATNTTYMTSSTIMDDRMSTISHGALTVDTSVASSAASMMSSIGSIRSTTTTGSSDMYGWEEELDRKETTESAAAWERELSRRLPSGGRTMGPRQKRVDGKRKGLLYRVLSLSSSRRGSTENVSNIPPMPPIPLRTTGTMTSNLNEYPTHSA